MTNFFVLTTILAIIGEGYCGYRHGGGSGYAVQGIQQASSSVQEEKVSSNYGASESGYASGYGNSLYGSSASGVASSAAYEQAQSYSGTSLESNSGYSSIGGSGIGRSASSYGGYSASRSQQQQSSYSSSSSATATVNYGEYWPGLYQDQFFRSICELTSAEKSAQLTKTFIARREINYYEQFSTLYAQNTDLQKYIQGCTGFIAESDAEREIFFNKIVSRQPATIIRSLLLFARHPQFFKSKLGNLLITQQSAELIQTASSLNYGFTHWQESISYLVKSRTYRSTLYSHFGCTDESSLWSALAQQYEYSTSGFFLLIRDVITRKTLLSKTSYYAVDYNKFVSQSNIWSRRTHKATYYSQFQSYKSTQSTYSSSNSAYDNTLIGGSDYGLSSGYGVRKASAATSSVSQSSQSIQQSEYGSSSGVIGSSGIGASSLNSGYSASSRVSQKTTSSSSTTIYQSHYPELYKDNLFQSLCNFDSFVRSNELYQRESQILASYDLRNVYINKYAKNSLFQSYFSAAIGLSYEEIQSDTFFTYVKENPGYFLKTIHLFARHPKIFKNQLVEYALTKTSAELIQTTESAVSSYYQDSIFQLLSKSSSFRTTFANIFRCDESAVYQKLKWAYSTNVSGFLLMVRHACSRRTLFKLDDYMSLNTKIWLSKRDYYSARLYAKNTYYKRFTSSRSSSFSSSKSFKKSKRSVTKASSGKFRSYGKKKNSDSSE